MSDMRRHMLFLITYHSSLLPSLLVWEGLALSGDPDAMVCELKM
jgi:hypothetical protein